MRGLSMRTPPRARFPHAWRRTAVRGAVALVVSLALPAARSQAPPPPVSEETARLVERERVRAQVETTLAELNDSRAWEGDHQSLFDRTTGTLRALGPAVVDYMVAELDRLSPVTFYNAAYVLGHVKTPGSTEALRKALETAETEGTKFAHYRKQWVVYALSIQGEPDAVDLLDAGNLRVGSGEFMEWMRLTEVVAMLTLPGSVERLHAHLERYAEDESLEPLLEVELRALGRIADRTSAPKILALARHPRWQVRAAAAHSLGLLGDPALADPLVEALQDPNGRVRDQAALALLDLKPPEKLQAILARLEVEQEPSLRAILYRTIASTGGEAMVEALRSHWGREGYEDRMGVVDALGELGSPRGLNLLRVALRDNEISVVLRAVAAMDRIGGAGAVETLLALVADPRWPVAQSVVEALSKRGEPRAAPRIADRLLRSVLQKPITDPTRRVEVTKLGDALVALRYPDPTPQIRDAAVLQTDPEIVDYLARLVKKLGLIQEYKAAVPKWVEALSSSDTEVRQLAAARLGELGGTEAARALVGAFGRAPTDEGVGILRALAAMRSPEAAALVERVLLDPSFDDREKARLRDMAAWAARRIGGERLADALRRSAERREGQDISVLTYLAVLEGKAAIPVLRSVRAPRLRMFTWLRGAEQERLDWILRRLALGRGIPSLDRPPDEIAF